MFDKTDLTLPASTKKEEIIKLLEDGLAPNEIARRLDTTVAYVYRTKCVLKNGKLTIVSTRKNSTKVSLQVEQNHLLSLPPLAEEDVERIYGHFRAGSKPWDIIHAYGFNPEAVELEHRRFLRMQEQELDFSRRALLEAIVQRVGDDSTTETIQLANQFRKNGNLTDEEARLLLFYLGAEQRSVVIASLVAEISKQSSQQTL
jgi:hypothetical protein